SPPTAARGRPPPPPTLQGPARGGRGGGWASRRWAGAAGRSQAELGHPRNGCPRSAPERPGRNHGVRRGQGGARVREAAGEAQHGRERHRIHPGHRGRQPGKVRRGPPGVAGLGLGPQRPPPRGRRRGHRGGCRASPATRAAAAALAQGGHAARAPGAAARGASTGSAEAGLRGR
ncbi:unnamed protein product, partial [Prorocentrum cordatum]